MLYKSTMELLIIELGSSLSLQELPFQEVKSLLINTLIKSSWDFLSSNNLYLRHDLEWSIPRENDTEIMTRFYLEKVPLDALSHINLCWLYLKAFFILDIVNGSRTFLLDKAWTGLPMIIMRQEFWPSQAKPPPRMWETWRNYRSWMFFFSEGIAAMKPDDVRRAKVTIRQDSIFVQGMVPLLT